MTETMDITHIIDTLNPEQREAATNLDTNLLVLAGAGSGKTRTIVHRIAYLIITGNAHWHNILTVTFTNKAASELKSRVSQLLPNQASTAMWIGTFHSICHKILRIQAKHVGLDPNFQVMDSDDQTRMIKKIHKSMGLDESQWPAKKTSAHINQMKENGKRAIDCFDTSNLYFKTLSEVYRAYEEQCIQSNVMDFTELMLKTCEILKQHPDICWQYQMQFKHILVDEFQDSNHLQYQLITLLKTEQQRIVVVGDDDQSIYSWRGAKIDHMFQFEQDFSPNKTIRLEQNYRSTEHILHAANNVIGNNQKRLTKKLWTDSPSGEKIKLYAAYNELDEAQFVCDQIESLKDKGHSLDDCAILYRSNAQSRIFEEKLGQMNLPYRVYGGLRFFERSEIKDILAYLRLIANPKDDQAFERVINLPPRGLGKVSLDKVRQTASQEKRPLYECAYDQEGLSGRAKQSMIGFLDLIEELRNSNLPLSELIHTTVDKSGIIPYLKSQKNPQIDSKIDNIQELINAAKHYDKVSEGAEALHEFLSHAILDQQHNQVTDGQQVQLMTLHASKGLEFPQVFLVGLEDDLFPHRMTHADNQQIEEERRLCYVGITRAMQELYISYAETRRVFGQETHQRPSRFIRELPQDNLETIRMGNTAPPLPQNQEAPYHLGQTVYHATFGEGVVLNYEADGANSRVQVRFTATGVKWLLCAYAKLENQPINS